MTILMEQPRAWKVDLANKVGQMTRDGTMVIVLPDGRERRYDYSAAVSIAAKLLA